MNDIFGQPMQQNYNYNPRKYEKPQEISPEGHCPHPHPHPDPDPCRQLPGTVLRINIPAGATINILNLVELTSPSGICLILRLPFLGGECGECHH
ncbi:hypothetical protein [Clostridium rhizosphaerae]|uniref:hypothetical protein n=1 Tax=Clostridium rhizosphaerae TaxID=2803861 RepID=UPI001A9C909B|nr:hypothetical protein [Clostridium rhizosphaerae]